jgi:outer membrane protein TolC
MRKIRWPVWALMVVAAVLAGASGPAAGADTRAVTLPELEQRLQEAPEVLVAAAELEQSLGRFETEQAITGWKAFGSAGTGFAQEVVDENRTRDYTRASARAGLRYPLLGTRSREQINLLTAEARTWENRQALELARRNSLNALRSYFINYWSAERRIDLSQTFMQGRETLERVIAERRNKGLLLEADRQEFLTGFELARRTVAAARAVQKRAGATINMLTRSELPDGFRTTPPLLLEPCRDEASLKAAVLDDHPELVLRRGRVEEQAGMLRLSRRSDLNANVELGGFGSADIPGMEPGYGVGVTLNMELPLGFNQAEQARGSASRAALRKSQLELNQRAAELLVEAGEAGERVTAAEADVQFARQRVMAALESLRENQLRTGYLPGDTIEKLQQSRFQYYRTSLDLIDAEANLLLARAALLNLAPAACANATPPDAGPADSSVIGRDPVNPDWLAWPKTLPPAAVTGAGTPAPPRGAIGIYLWASRPWLEGRAADWEALRRHGIDRILLSLDSAQIKAAGTPPGAARLRGFLERAQGARVSVDLLLGEPLWVLPGHRQDLLRIIQQLRPFAFDGLHLDLEPDQLDAKTYSRDYLLAQLLHTLQAAARVSSWPLGISIHPRYFDRSTFDLCLGCALAQVPVAETVLMIYRSDPQEAARRAAAVMAENPGLRISVALSVEPFLPPSESYAGKGKAGVTEAISTLRNRLSKEGLGSVLIQSWTHFEAMHP